MIGKQPVAETLRCRSQRVAAMTAMRMLQLQLRMTEGETST